MSNQLPGARLSFRIAMFAGGLGLIGLVAEPMHGLFAVLLWAAAAAFLYQSVLHKKDPITLRRRRFGYGVAALAAGILLWIGVVATLATPLIVLAAVCGALGVIALLGSPADSYPE
jgi:hypothetical protein